MPKVGAAERLPPEREIVAPAPSVKPLERVKVPLVRVRVPAPLTVVPATLLVTPAALLMVRLSNVVTVDPPIVCAAEPLKETVPVPGVKVPPLLVQLPSTVNVALFAESSTTPPLEMVRLWIGLTLASRTAWFVVLGTTASMVAVGTTPSDQFPAVFQSVLTAPVQVSWLVVKTAWVPL